MGEVNLPSKSNGTILHGDVASVPQKYTAPAFVTFGWLVCVLGAPTNNLQTEQILKNHHHSGLLILISYF